MGGGTLDPRWLPPIVALRAKLDDVMTQHPIDYASGPQANSRFRSLGAQCLLFSLAGIVLGLGLFAIGVLAGFGARGGGPGILVATAGVVLGPLLNLVAFVLGIVALLRKGPRRTMAVIGTVLSGIIVLPLLALAVVLAFKAIL
jgi:hypothetical protein